MLDLVDAEEFTFFSKWAASWERMGRSRVYLVKNGKVQRFTTITEK